MTGNKRDKSISPSTSRIEPSYPVGGDLPLDWVNLTFPHVRIDLLLVSPARISLAPLSPDLKVMSLVNFDVLRTCPDN